MSLLAFNCLIHGEDPYRGFTVVVEDTTRKNVSILKKLIKEMEAPDLDHVDASDLDLFQVSLHWDELGEGPVLVDLDNYSKLSPFMKLSSLSDHVVDDNRLHIIVVVPGTSLQGSSRSSFCGLPDTRGYSKRHQTVTGIYQKLCQYKYVQVRGTPASGKSVLAMLLQEYILFREPNTEVVRVPIWKEESEMEMRARGNWRKWLKWEDEVGTVLIIDEAQSSYWDRTFWLDTIKQMNPTAPYRIITFASYGTTGSTPLAAPFFVGSSQIIGLHSADIKTQLLLSKEEFIDFVNTAFRNHRFDSALLDSFYDLTDGHVGACYDVLSVICEHESYRKYSECYTTERFNTHFTMKTLLSGLTTENIFLRGLPDVATLREPEINALFKTFLKTENPIELESVSKISGLESCVKQGWIYETAIGQAERSNQYYMFPSPLHRRYIENLLFPVKR